VIDTDTVEPPEDGVVEPDGLDERLRLSGVLAARNWQNPVNSAA
jgi:hypothetical protein